MKQCPKCKVDFDCKVHDIQNCECSQIQLSDNLLQEIANEFTDCLCLNCLKNLQKSAYKRQNSTHQIPS